MKFSKSASVVLIIISMVSAQLYIPADPFDILSTEEKIMAGGKNPGSLMIRPVIPQSTHPYGTWSMKIRNDFYYNNGPPNLENTSDRWVGKGAGFFTSANIAYKSDYIFASFEPYYFISQNDDYDEPQRILKFSHLNDNKPHAETPYTSTGIREAQLYLNYNGFGGGYSNANMWWGPGIHSSLMMSNNTTGFGHLMLGTISEQKYKDWGFNGRYIISKFGKNSISKPYYSGFIFNTTYYSIPTVTFGFSRSFLSGGNNTNYDISLLEAALLPFQLVKIEKPINNSESLNPLEQTYTGYINLLFPKSGLVLFLEYGRNEGLKNYNDLLSHPDHSRAFIFGIRKYSIFNNINLFFGIEYANIIQSPYWQLRETRDWYSATQFDFNTYNGRYWAAHSGPDSDDFTIYLGYNRKNISVIPSINYERHNVTHPNALITQYANTLVEDNIIGTYYIEEDRVVLYDWSHLAEGKIELKLNIEYLLKGINLSMYFEHEWLFNRSFMHSSPQAVEDGIQIKSSNILMFKVEKYFSGMMD